MFEACYYQDSMLFPSLTRWMVKALRATTPVQPF